MVTRFVVPRRPQHSEWNGSPTIWGSRMKRPCMWRLYRSLAWHTQFEHTYYNSSLPSIIDSHHFVIFHIFKNISLDTRKCNNDSLSNATFEFRRKYNVPSKLTDHCTDQKPAVGFFHWTDQYFLPYRRKTNRHLATPVFRHFFVGRFSAGRFSAG